MKRARPYLVCCLGELNDVVLQSDSIDASILKEHPWLKVCLRRPHPVHVWWNIRLYAVLEFPTQ